jgi:hypothetical protein
VGSIRAWAVVTLIVVGGYHLLRSMAAQCRGPQCDVYIPISLLVPMLALLTSAVTGVTATASAWQRARTMPAERPHGWWLILAGATFISVIGPPLTLAVFRDNPDAFVATATLLVAVAPVAGLTYTASV